MNDEFYKELTEECLQRSLNRIKKNSMAIYEEYWKTSSRDSAFLIDLIDSLTSLDAILEVYARDKKIHPQYAIEKLRRIDFLISSTSDYFKNKGNYEK